MSQKIEPYELALEFYPQQVQRKVRASYNRSRLWKMKRVLTWRYGVISTSRVKKRPLETRLLYVRTVQPGRIYIGPHHRKEFIRMAQPGLGVLIQALSGAPGETRKTAEMLVGRRVETAFLKDDELHLVFDDGSEVEWHDAGQSCCENRYMTCDDDLPSFTGDTFAGWELATAESPGADYGEHDVQFLRLKMGSGNVITACTHNEHNGYYGGFAVQCNVVKYVEAK